LAFHRYPQLIRTFCNRSRCGPPPACSARFSLAMGRSPGFGSFRDDSSPFRTRVRCGSACPWLSLAAPAHSSAHSTKGTPSPRAVTDPRLRPAGSAWFQDLFHSPRRGAFHRSLTVLVHYRSLAVFSLGRWSALLPAGCHVSGGTHDPWSPDAPSRHLRDSHPLRCPVPAGFGLAAHIRRALCRPLHQARSTPRWHRRQAVPPPRFGLLPLRSPLLRESSLLLGVLRCFTSPGALPTAKPSGARPCAGRVAPFGNLRIPGCQRLPGALRRVAASFLGRQRQGIHHAPFVRRPSSVPTSHGSPGHPGTPQPNRLAPARTTRPSQSAFQSSELPRACARPIAVLGSARSLLARHH
jgi:hypothetical protein